MSSTSNVVAITPSEPDETQETQTARSPERQALSTAITAAHRISCQIGAGRDEIERARKILEVAEDDAKAAADAVNVARERDATALMANIKSRRVLSGAEQMKKARARLASAEDDVEVARAALARLEAALVDVEKNLRKAELRIQGCVNAVLVAEAAPLIERLEKIKSEIPVLQSVLHFIRQRAFERHGNVFHEIAELAAPLAEVAPKIFEAVEMGLQFNPMVAEQRAVFANWKEAVDALSRDADAPLPALNG